VIRPWRQALILVKRFAANANKSRHTGHICRVPPHTTELSLIHRNRVAFFDLAQWGH
jgi:hypothetical protein